MAIFICIVKNGELPKDCKLWPLLVTLMDTLFLMGGMVDPTFFVAKLAVAGKPNLAMQTTFALWLLGILADMS